MQKITPAFLVACVTLSTATAGEVSVEDVKVQCDKQNTCRFDVTLRHADTGWEHYANRFEVLSDDGEILGTRVLHHPHVEEQPFTRALNGVKIPTELTSVQVRGNDSVHGAGKAVTVELPQ